jgi:hypothetical protein
MPEMSKEPQITFNGGENSRNTTQNALATEAPSMITMEAAPETDEQMTIDD